MRKVRLVLTPSFLEEERIMLSEILYEYAGYTTMKYIEDVSREAVFVPTAKIRSAVGALFYLQPWVANKTIANCLKNHRRCDKMRL